MMEHSPAVSEPLHIILCQKISLRSQSTRAEDDGQDVMGWGWEIRTITANLYRSTRPKVFTYPFTCGTYTNTAVFSSDFLQECVSLPSKKPRPIMYTRISAAHPGSQIFSLNTTTVWKEIRRTRL